MSDDVRWDLIDKIPDDMSIYGSDHVEAPLTVGVWRDALEHPYVEGHGFCRTCGPATTCMLMAFYDAVMLSVVRELDKMGALRPREDNEKENET